MTSSFIGIVTVQIIRRKPFALTLFKALDILNKKEGIFLAEKRFRKKRIVIFFLGFILIGTLVGLSFLHQSINREYQELLANTPAPTLSPPMLDFRATANLYRNGSVGPEVKQLQQRLKDLGYYSGEIDGQFGNGTKAAVMSFQSQNGLQADGAAGEDTLKVLYSDAAKTFVPTPEPLMPTPTPS